jgi:4-amino-4-deoxy-L-arabinose transferase-like glycosyltransferase
MNDQGSRPSLFPTEPAAPHWATLSFSVFDVALFATLLLATTIRLWNIASVPAALHPDEFAGWLGVHDMLSGKVRPSVFFDYRVVYLPLYGILESISTGLFGNNVSALRAPAALLGTLTCLSVGLLASTITRSRRALLIASGLMAVLPWDISLSRVALERAPTLPCLLLGLYFLRRGLILAEGKSIWLAFGALGIGTYSYRASLFYSLALTVGQLIIEYRHSIKMWRDIEVGAVIWALIALPSVSVELESSNRR